MLNSLNDQRNCPLHLILCVNNEFYSLAALYNSLETSRDNPNTGWHTHRMTLRQHLYQIVVTDKPFCVVVCGYYCINEIFKN